MISLVGAAYAIISFLLFGYLMFGPYRTEFAARSIGWKLMVFICAPILFPVFLVSYLRERDAEQKRNLQIATTLFDMVQDDKTLIRVGTPEGLRSLLASRIEKVNIQYDGELLDLTTPLVVNVDYFILDIRGTIIKPQTTRVFNVFSKGGVIFGPSILYPSGKQVENLPILVSSPRYLNEDLGAFFVSSPETVKILSGTLLKELS